MDTVYFGKPSIVEDIGNKVILSNKRFDVALTMSVGNNFKKKGL